MSKEVQKFPGEQGLLQKRKAHEEGSSSPRSPKSPPSPVGSQSRQSPPSPSNLKVKPKEKDTDAIPRAVREVIPSDYIPKCFAAPRREFLMAGVTFSVIGSAWSKTCDHLSQAVKKGAKVTIFVADYLSDRSQNMTVSERGIRRLQELFSSLADVGDSPNLFFYIVDFPFYSTYFQFDKGAFYRIVHTHRCSTSRGTILEIIPGDPEYEDIEKEISFFQESLHARRLTKSELEKEGEKYLEKPKEKKGDDSQGGPAPPVDANLAAFNAAIKEKKFSTGQWVLYIDGELVATAKNPEELEEKITKDCLLTCVGVDQGVTEIDAVCEVRQNIHPCGHSAWLKLPVSIKTRSATFDFKVDTGASQTCVDQTIVDALQLHSTGNAQFHGAAGPFTAPVYYCRVNLNGRDYCRPHAPLTSRALLGTDLIGDYQLLANQMQTVNID